MSPLVSRDLRRLVLGTALCTALVAGLGLRPPAAVAQPQVAPPATTHAAPETGTTPPAAADAAAPPAKGGHGVRIDIDLGGDAAKRAGSQAADEGARGDAQAAGIIVDKEGKRVRVLGSGKDHDYESFDQFVTSEPAAAGMIVLIVAIVFLSPALIVGLVIWYRLRKTRMVNETMLKLAERGAVAPAVAMQALAAGHSPERVAGGEFAATPALADQVKELRRQAATSDLRKGVIMGAVGLGLVLYSLLGDREPNVVGLVLLFLGIGYGVLWWFEARPADSGPGAASAPASGPRP